MRPFALIKLCQSHLNLNRSGRRSLQREKRYLARRIAKVFRLRCAAGEASISARGMRTHLATHKRRAKSLFGVLYSTMRHEPKGSLTTALRFGARFLKSRYAFGTQRKQHTNGRCHGNLGGVQRQILLCHANRNWLKDEAKTFSLLAERPHLIGTADNCCFFSLARQFDAYQCRGRESRNKLPKVYADISREVTHDLRHQRYRRQ